MNKLLLASTALVASTTFAMADVSLSGSAEMGVFGVNVDSDIDDDDADLQFHTDIDVTFSMAGETDAGLTFGASIDIDESDGDGECDVVTDATTGDVFINGVDTFADDAACNVRGGSRAFDADTQGGETIFVDGTYGRLTMGDTDGALDWALEEAIIGGSIADDHEHAGYNGNGGLDETYDGQIARYEYAFGDFSVAASAEIEDGGDMDPVLGLGARYSGELAGFTFGAGLGYQSFGGDDEGDSIDGDAIGVSLSAKMDNGIQAILNYSEADFSSTIGGIDSDEEVDHFGIAVGYEFGEFLVAANYGEFSGETDGVDDGDISGYGVVVNYDLGGGATLQAGYGNSDLGDAGLDDVESYSFGISMSF